MPQSVNVSQRTEFPRREENLGNRNMFDLSHDHKTTISMGRLYPFLTLETLPGDTFFISSEVMLRFAPLYLPIMHRVNLSLDYHFCPYRILWQGYPQNDSWEGFIIRDANLLLLRNPFISPAFPVDEPTSVMEYMGFPSKLTTAPGDLTPEINCLPISAYVRIWDFSYRNYQVQTQRWFNLTAGDNTSNFDIIFDLGPSDYYRPFYRNWNRDIYTSATPTPQVGADVLVPMIHTADVDPLDPLLDPGPTRWRLIADGTEPASGALAWESGPETSFVGSQPVYLDIQETAASIRNLRYALKMTEFLERNMRAGDDYRQNIRTFFGVDPNPLSIDEPLYIGGKRGRVVVSEVLSTAETVDVPVGGYAGQALGLESSKTIKYTCYEHGVIIGIISVYPQSSYMQGMDRMWQRRSRFDYAFEQFALIGDDSLKNKDVNYSFLAAQEAWDDEIFGYVRRYYDWTTHNDIISGGMRDYLISFHLGRIFDALDPTTVQLNSEFLECKPRIQDVFQVAEDEDEIYAHIYNDVKVLRRLPKYGIPGI